MHAIRSHLFTVTRSANNDAEATGFIHNGLRCLNAERRVVVEGVVHVCAVVDDVIAFLTQISDDLFLELKTGVISGNMDAHGILLRGSRTSNAH